jgi:flagellar basal-body rod protein FlgG
LAIEGQGFFEVTLPDGRTVYTRDGALKVNANGKVVNSEGFEIGSGFQDIPIGRQGIAISANGRVTVEIPGGMQSFSIQLAKFPNPAGLKSLGNNLYEATPASGEASLGDPTQDGFGSIRQHYLETSNVNVVQSMVNMIIAQRAYEMNSKSIQTADEMLSRINQLKH